MDKKLFRIKVNTTYRYSIFAENRNKALMILMDRFINEAPEVDIKNITIQELEGKIIL